MHVANILWWVAKHKMKNYKEHRKTIEGDLLIGRHNKKKKQFQNVGQLTDQFHSFSILY